MISDVEREVFIVAVVPRKPLLSSLETGFPGSEKSREPHGGGCRP